MSSGNILLHLKTKTKLKQSTQTIEKIINNKQTNNKNKITKENKKSSRKKMSQKEEEKM